LFNLQYNTGLVVT
jgi:hypothetical protein